MVTSRASKPRKRTGQHITRTACEPCREKRAKCHGGNPCSRCKTRNIDCHSNQRGWISKRSLRDEAASLREQAHRRDRLLDAISGRDASGEDILRRLQDGCLTYDMAYERLRGTSQASGININTTVGEKRHNSTDSCGSETCCSPSTAQSTMLSSTTGHSPFSFMDHYLTDGTISQPSPISEAIPQQSNDLRQPMDPMQSFSWASSTPDINSSGTLLEELTMGPSVSPGIVGDCPAIFDPLLWPPIDSSNPLGPPTGLMADPTNVPKAETFFPFMD